MKKVLIATLLFAPALAVSSGIGFINKATFNGADITIVGTLYGLSTGPTGGEYEVLITNANSFKGNEFTNMNCTAHKKSMVEKLENKAIMETTYYGMDKTITNATGYISGMTALPANGYTVNVRNTVKNSIWNLLKCTIK